MDRTRLDKRILSVVMVMAVLLLTFGVSLAQDNTVNVTITASEFKFEPNELNVTAGTEVTFNVTNAGQFPHNVTFVAPDGTETNLFAQNLAAGQSMTGTFTFNAAGEWRMYCPVGQHEEQGMVGTVTVAAAAGAESAAGASQAQETGPTPGTLPATGGGDAFVWAIGGAALLLIGGGFLLRRRGTVRG